MYEYTHRNIKKCMNIHLLPEIHGLRRAEYEEQCTTHKRCLGGQDLIQTM